MKIKEKKKKNDILIRSKEIVELFRLNTYAKENS